MKIRGSQTITKDLTLPRSGGSTPILGRIAYTDDTGTLNWQDIYIPVVEARLYPNKRSLVYDGDTLYSSLIVNADGTVVTDPAQWQEVGGVASSGDQSDWDELSVVSPAYILNKPDLSQFLLRSETLSTVTPTNLIITQADLQGLAIVTFEDLFINYTTDADDDWKFYTARAEITITLDSIGLPIGFTQRVLNSNSADINIVSADTLEGSEPIVLTGQTAEYTITAAGVWAIDINSGTSSGTGDASVIFVANYTSLPSSPSQEILYITKDKGKGWEWTGSVWKATLRDVVSFVAKINFPVTGVIDTIYIDETTASIYRWDTVIVDYVQLLGASGSALEADYEFNTSTLGEDPTTGKVSINNALPSLASVFYINEIDVNSFNNDFSISNLKVDDFIKLTDTGNTKTYVFIITSLAVNNIGWWSIGIGYQNSTGTFINDESLVLQFIFISTTPTGLELFSDSAAPATKGYKLIANPSIVTGENAVNLMGVGDAVQDNIVYMKGAKFHAYTTIQVNALPDSELGTFVFDITLGSLVQCIDASPGFNIWAPIGGGGGGGDEQGGIAWAVSISYNIGDITTESSEIYICLATHLSVGGNVAAGSPTQINQTKWRQLGGASLLRIDGYAFSGQDEIIAIQDYTENPLVFINGSFLLADKYTILTDTITLLTPMLIGAEYSVLDNINSVVVSSEEIPQRTEFIATAGQTVFSVPNNVSGEAVVYINGSVLLETEYGVGGTDVTFNSALFVGDEVLIINYI